VLKWLSHACGCGPKSPSFLSARANGMQWEQKQMTLRHLAIDIAT
jgi:hypothetical protein